MLYYSPMVEAAVIHPLPLEITRTRRWIEEDVIKKGTCPPLIAVAKELRDGHGQIDWAALSQYVEIVSYHSVPVDSPSLRVNVTNDYLRYIEHATYDSDAPLTKIFILPDFRTNRDYDTFIADLQVAAFLRLTTTQKGQQLAEAAFLRTAQGSPDQDMVREIMASEDKTFRIAHNVLVTMFKPVNFYGKKLSDKDLEGLETDRGHLQREKVLSRAPYYLAQIPNIAGSAPITNRFNATTVFRHNTELAITTPLHRHEAAIRRFRRGDF